MQVIFDADGINNTVIPNLDAAVINIKSAKARFQNDVWTNSAHFSPFIVPQNFSLRSEVMNFHSFIRNIELRTNVLITWLETTVRDMRNLEAEAIRQQELWSMMSGEDGFWLTPESDLDRQNRDQRAFIDELMAQGYSREYAMMLIATGAVTVPSSASSFGQLYGSMTDSGVMVTNGFASMVLPTVPFIFQHFYQDQGPWASLPYGGRGSIASSGCYPASYATIISTLTGNTITPEETARWCVDNGKRVIGAGTAHSATQLIMEEYGLVATPLTRNNPQQIIDTLLNGGLVFFSVGGEPTTTFTTGGHGLVMREVAADGTIILACSNSKSNVNNQAFDLDFILAHARSDNIWAVTNP